MSNEPPPIADLESCLFCGIGLTDETRTREHVFPQWLQREYHLFDQELVLLNGSSVRYAQLLVAACEDCNNVHASQLEHRIQQDVASPQDMYIWLLKLQLSVMHWETARPASQDRRRPEAQLPIIPSDAFDIGFLRSLFDVLKRPDPQFVPDPLGSVFSFPARSDEFFYSDKLFQHPLAGSDAHNYSAGCIVVHGRCWIALFDDMGQIHDRAVDHAAMAAQIATGKDPLQFFPELMWMRACLHWLPHTLVLGPAGGSARGVAFVPPMGQPHELPRRQEDLDLFYALLGWGADLSEQESAGDG